MAFNTISTSGTNPSAAAKLSESVSNRMDRGFRVFSEGTTTNQKVYKESTTLAKVNHDLGNLRTKQRHYYERVPQERVDEFHLVRTVDIDRSQKMVNNRFPELSAARDAFLGQEQKLPPKKVQASEVTNFASVVEKLAQEEEPFPARLQLQQTQSQMKEPAKATFDDRSKSLQVNTNSSVRQSKFEALSKPTMSASIKTKYIVRSRHGQLTANRFLPVNHSEARQQVKKEVIHDAGEPKRNDFEAMQRSTMVMRSIHGSSVFRNTSPVTQDHFKAKPSATLDLDNDFGRFCPAEKKTKNARHAVLDNFKEISRIMTQNFLTHKKLEKRYEKTAIPKSELAKMREEEGAQQRMTKILQKMHSPSNFAAPELRLPGQKSSSPYRSVMTTHNRNASMMHAGSARLSQSPTSNQTKSKFITRSALKPTEKN